MTNGTDPIDPVFEVAALRTMVDRICVNAERQLEHLHQAQQNAESALVGYMKENAVLRERAERLAEDLRLETALQTSWRERAECAEAARAVAEAARAVAEAESHIAAGALDAAKEVDRG